ncbi:MAG: orotidine 5'-phosphate decarboxylase [Leptospiraceae bacterium]|nr:MAG: orotidine 5'-phosphate decarboxylase [Leptospiraceae bacterium]
MSTYNRILKKIIFKSKKNLCIGLDPDKNLIPSGYKKNIEGIYNFLIDIINYTYDNAIAYKINLAFYECYGKEGWELIEKIIKYIKIKDKEINTKKILIADAKRGDIGNTSKKYAKAFFDFFDFDAITLHPYMGIDSILPFIEYQNKGSIILCLTSNPSNIDFEFYGDPPLYEIVAKKIVEWNRKYDNVMAVIGATNQEEHLEQLSKILIDIPVLVPGIGAQGGNLDIVMKYFKDRALINIGRSILYASNNIDELPLKINEYLNNYYNKIYKYFNNNE